MPVIGRLDEQIDELLIKPVSKRRDDEREREHDELARERGERTQARDKHTPEKNSESPAQSETRGASLPAPTQTPRAGESSAKADELPVWLL